MSRKVFLVDVNRCNGCHNCQVACKDEHCDQSWLPYAVAQPDTGQFWCRVEQRVHGTVPKVNMTYWPVIGAQTDALKEYAPEVLADREDGLVVIDPEKAKGRKDLAEKFEGVFWNEELEVPQGCTGCAHLLDDGWDVPRCVDACAVGGIRFGEESDFADELEQAEKLDPLSSVYYLNLPKRWVAGQVIDDEAREVVIGAKITLRHVDQDGSDPLTAFTDEFGDFWFRKIAGAKYQLTIEKDGFLARTVKADATSADVNVGAIKLYKTQRIAV